MVGQPLEKCGDKIPRWYLSQKMIAPFIPVICLWNFVTFFSMEVLIHFTSVPRKKYIFIESSQKSSESNWQILTALTYIESYDDQQPIRF